MRDLRAFFNLIAILSSPGNSVSAPVPLPLQIYTIQEGQTVYAGVFE